jgi:acyl-CoA synthetase (AMP-forming)/AMP-acid ligase II
MHMLILEAAERVAPPPVRIRLIANAAGPLLHSVAERLRARFGGAAVLPSYGMTECMPITSPPIEYALERPGTSGRAIGPELSVLEADGKECERGAVGRICVRGPPTMQAYEGDGKATQESFTADGFFDTGDLARERGI